MERNLTETERREKQAFDVVQKFIATEKSYLRDLNLLTDNFRSYIKKASKKPIIPNEELDKIIGYLVSLRIFTENFIKTLETRVETWNLLPKISDIVIKYSSYFKIYSIYVRKLPEKFDLLKECVHKYKKFGKALKKFESLEGCHGITIKQYMLEPVDRLLRYKSILEEYLKYQSIFSVDYVDTQEAIQILRQVADDAAKPLTLESVYLKLLRLHKFMPV